MSKISVVKVLQLKCLLFTSKCLWHEKLIWDDMRTDMRNKKYTLELFIGVAWNICKMIWNESIIWFTWYEKPEIQK